MFDLRRPGDGPVWVGHYSLQGRLPLDGDRLPEPPGSTYQDPHMKGIASSLNEAVRSLNDALGRV